MGLTNEIFRDMQNVIMTSAFIVIVFIVSVTLITDVEASSPLDENRITATFKVSSCTFPLTCAERSLQRTNDTRAAVPGPRGRGGPPYTRAGGINNYPDARLNIPRQHRHFSPGNSKLSSSTITPPAAIPDTQNISRQPCYCDPECWIYGDCCQDVQKKHPHSDSVPPSGRTVHSSITGVGESGKPPATVTADKMNCRLLNPDQPQFVRNTVYMVDRCPDESGSKYANKCHKDVPDNKYVYLLDVPVVSKLTGVIYTNIYCAKCHHDHDTVHYNHSIACNCDLPSKSQLRKMEYWRGFLTWVSPIVEGTNCLNGVKETACILSVLYPSDVGRRCEYELVDKCSDDWKNKQADEKLCKSYNYYVENQLQKVYKNPHCARCNHVRMDVLSCLSSTVYTRFGMAPTGDVFFLSDLFTTNKECSEEEVLDFVFGQCSEEQQNNNSGSNFASSVVYIILMAFSITAMALHIAIFFILFKQRNLHTKNLFSMVFLLFWAEILLLICSRECHNKVGCYISTLIVYYLFMVAFFWMNVMSYDICKTFRSTKIRSNSSRSYLKYAIYAFGCPALLTIIAVAVDLVAPQSGVTPGFGVHGFWFSNKGGLILFFIGPTELIFLANICMLGISMYDIYQHQKATKFASATVMRKSNVEKATSKERDKFLSDDANVDASKLNQLHGKIKESIDKIKMDKERLVLYTKLALIMGVPWFFAIFDTYIVCRYIFNILNGLQGVFIFLAFDCKSKIWVDVFERLGWQSVADSLAAPSTSGTHDTSVSSSGVRNRLLKATSENKEQKKYSSQVPDHGLEMLQE